MNTILYSTLILGFVALGSATFVTPTHYYAPGYTYSSVQYHPPSARYVVQPSHVVKAVQPQVKYVVPQAQQVKYVVPQVQQVKYVVPQVKYVVPQVKYYQYTQPQLKYVYQPTHSVYAYNKAYPYYQYQTSKAVHSVPV